MSNISTTKISPRLIRMRDAPFYLGMDKKIFNKEVRKYITEVPIGKQGIAFDKLDLDAWTDYYKTRSGRPAANHTMRGKLWDVKKRQDCSNAGNTGTLINKYTDADFEKALELILSRKRKST